MRWAGAGIAMAILTKGFGEHQGCPCCFAGFWVNDVRGRESLEDVRRNDATNVRWMAGMAVNGICY